MKQEKDNQDDLKNQIKSRNAQVKELARRWKLLKAKYDEASQKLYQAKKE